MFQRTRLTAARAVVAFLISAYAFGGIAHAGALEFKKLSMRGNWQPYGEGTEAQSAAIDSNGVVHRKGAMHQPNRSSARLPSPFILPPAMRPNRWIYRRVD